MKSGFSDADERLAVDRWGPRFGSDLARRVYTSRLLGQEPALVLHGGGNTSVKSSAREITGEETRVLYVKGSGWDLATIEPEGFPACRIQPLLRCLGLASMSDDDMVRALRSQMLDPASPTPSVEALLHAYLPGRFVDHTHANAVLAVVDQPDGARHAREVWGDGLLLLPYVMPGFVLARKVAELGEQVRHADTLVLDKHGIFTWGETAEESYTRMIDAVTKAEAYVERARGVVPGDRERCVSESARNRRTSLTPVIRGALERAPDGAKFVCDWRDEPEVLALCDRADATDLVRIGTMTPDHVIRTKPFPLWLGELPADRDRARSVIEASLASYGEWYARYFDENRPRHSEPLTRLDRLPRILLAKGLGALTVGKTIDDARIAGDIYAHTASVILDATALGRYEPVTLSDLFDVEYWSLEQAKLKQKKAPTGGLAGRVALVTGAARGIGRATAEHFLAEAAHVVLSDADGEALEHSHLELKRRYGRRVHSYRADVTKSDEVRALVGAAVDAFGGLDVVVSNAGNAPSGRLHTDEGEAALRRSLELNFLSHQTVAHAATEVLLAQATGGCLLFNASKSAFNPGRDFGPYAVPKAAVVALMRQYAVDLGSHGIRSNAVNADRIHTALFDGLVEARAKARGVSPEEYFRDNLLHRETTAADVARAFGFLATAEATTGTVITVDGGNAAAFPR
jgi:rhamnose utilization protein RhaD (predicted bifunctional aldolase and dehydrogenase)/NAD(P)-dependent dehydrogenase (short-subunit alcohol dehydrogenase family)